MIVIDASALLKLVLDEEHSKETRAIVHGELGNGESIVAPELVFTETLNTLRTQNISGKKLAEAELAAAVDDLFEIFTRIDPVSTIDVGRNALKISIEHKLTVYDAVYIASSILKGAPLLTFDREMALAARKLHVEVMGYSDN
ncbi:MAG TPA: type II toxin-antitoxin system VapC family toxin [Candidatus Acidoferrales bacterium]|nr:type II toxin-antitoxin system VapC family toxin [Candidatus Acidoferrales bacterium]